MVRNFERIDVREDVHRSGSRRLHECAQSWAYSNITERFVRGQVQQGQRPRSDRRGRGRSESMDSTNKLSPEVATR